MDKRKKNKTLAFVCNQESHTNDETQVWNSPISHFYQTNQSLPLQNHLLVNNVLFLFVFFSSCSVWLSSLLLPPQNNRQKMNVSHT